MATETQPTVKGTIRAFISIGKEFFTREDIETTAHSLHIDPVFSFVVVQAYGDEVFWDEEGHVVAADGEIKDIGDSGQWKKGFRIPKSSTDV